METMLKSSQLKNMIIKLGYDGFFGVDLVGRIGRLAIMWSHM